ncbi:hypothetical protein EUX98_g7107 [Antrodiella citrinella]|uniref:Kinesin-like protein n=1 Tax=Antrodiella citrinella TaxID=2447956 RepID=A0A4V3XI16_9APHY|nr:hypothetical protein EUX98_g7107 [Antrodiella citrinella]
MMDYNVLNLCLPKAERVNRMASKPRAATRASNRTKVQAEPVASGTRVTRAAAKSKDTGMKTTALASTTKTTSRKPFVSRDNSPELKQAEKSAPVKPKVLKAQASVSVVDDNDREPVKAYLRIRPNLNDGGSTSKPYLEPISDLAVRMVDPSGSVPSSSRLSAFNPSSIYTFSHVFPPDSTQPDFFAKTTLPLVQDVLNGQDALLFAYGVTNSGKTYTIQGGGHEGSAGILPRSLDVIFNSIEGLHGDGRYQPVRLQGIELADETPYPLDPSSQYRASTLPALADILENLSLSESEIDSTTLKLDRNHEYTVWISYAEVYNEKAYDLLASVDDPSARSSPASGIPRPTSTYLQQPIPSQSNPLQLTRKALAVKPCPAADADSSDSHSTGRYVAGLRQLRVHSAAQAKELLRLGQLHRTVFGTLANSQSSRSHAFVTIKVLRVHRGERNDPSSIQTSRLTLVDLAGSERTKHTQTSGDRLREAGNINNSLMVLGQCMETMRSNQRVLARSLGGGVNAGSRLDTRDVKKGLAVVPFRHSKLTEILMDYFVGEGRVAMIVNINPYDTGYDENSHVMRFAALAREVCTTAPTAIPRPVPKASGKAKAVSASHTRQVTLSLGGPGRKVSETHLEVLEEDEEPGEGDEDGDDNEPINPLVNALFDEIEMLRMQVFEAEMRAAVIEAETREEVMQEMEARMRNVEKMYTRRLMAEVQQNEMKMDEKLDMLQNSGLLAKPKSVDSDSEDDEDDVLESIDEESEVNLSLQSSYSQHDEDEESGSELSRSPSPLAGKSKPKMSSIKPVPVPRSPEVIESDTESETETEAEGSDEIEEWSSPPPAPKTAKAGPSKKNRLPESDNEIEDSDDVEELEDELDALTLAAGGSKDRDAIAVIPNKEARQKAVASIPNLEYVPRVGEVEVVVKPKRQSKKPKAAAKDVNEEGTLRRSTRISRS